MSQDAVADYQELHGPAVVRDCPQGLLGLLRSISKEHPTLEATADEAGALTYAQLEAWSDAIARELRQSAAPARPVVVAIPRSTALLAALLGVLKAGLPYLPVDPTDPANRIGQMIEVSGSRIALVAPGGREALVRHGLQTIEVAAPVTASRDEFDPLPDVPAEQPAYVLFTSGSTGVPKGVVVPSLALCNRLLWMRDAYQVGPTDRILQKTPVTFDVSGWELFLPLISGASCVFLPPEEHRDPLQVARAIIDRQITICHFVPSMLREFLRWPDAARCTSLRAVFCSGEALPVDVARRFVATLPARLHNLYGPTEAAIDVTYWSVPADEAAIERVYIGRPIDNCVLAVLDEERRPVPAGDEGELCIGGMPLALGYLNRPDLTAHAFVPALPGSSVPIWYRTGDRVRVVGDELEYLGRIDDQVKIRGQRIEPQEVEHHLAVYPGVTAAVVVPAKVGDDTQLVAWVQFATEPADLVQAATQMRDYLAERVPPAYVPAHFLPISEIPSTSSGKRDRKLLRQRAEDRLRVVPAEPARAASGDRPLLSEQATGKPAANETIEQAVGRLWRQYLPAAAGSDGTFLSLGGHSLLGSQLAAEVNAQLNVRLSPTYFLRNDPTLAQLCAAIREAARESRPVPVDDLPDGAVPAAPGQRRLWLLSNVFPDSPAYNVVGALRINQHLAAEPLSAAVTAVAARQRILLAALRDDSGLVLHVDSSVTPKVVVEAGHPDEIDAFLVRRRDVVLDPECPPLFEVGVLNLSDGTSVLVATLHHAIADQRSLEVFLTELSDEYDRVANGAPVTVPGLPAEADYRRYAQHQRTRAEAEREADLGYWRQALTDAPPKTDLPYGLAPKAVPSFRGSSVSVSLDEQTNRAVRELSVRAGCSPAMLFLTAAGIVLSRWTLDPDVVIGVAVADRSRAEFQRTIGFFVDTVPVRLALPDNPPMSVALDRVRQALAEGVEHSGVPFDEIAGVLRPERDLATNPVFQIWFNDLSEAAVPERFGGASAAPLDVPVGWSLFDLGFYLHREAGQYQLRLVHAADRYGKEVAEALLDQWRRAMLAMIADIGQPGTNFGAGGDLAAEESSARAALAVPESELSGDPLRALVATVLEHAVQTTDATAVRTSAGQRYSYGWLREAVLAAASMVERLVPANRAVALLGRTHPLLPVALLACWHTGRPVLLLDAESPQHWQHLAWREVDAAAVLVLDGAVESELPVLNLAGLLENPVDGAAGSGDGTARLGGADGADASRDPLPFGHALLTSGTTGTPSVVRAPREALPTAFAWYAATVGLTGQDVFCALAGPGHDPILRQVVLPLTLGAAVVLPAPAERFDPVRLLEVLRAQRCTVLDLTPGHAHLLTSAAVNPLPDVRVLGSYGASLTDPVARDLRRLLPNAAIYNLYGTTETPQVSSIYRWSDPAGEPLSWRGTRASVPVGRGTAYRELRVVTPTGQPTGVGQLGEVVAVGAGLAVGTKQLYGTGDRGRYTPDGDVEICGRLDRQVSVRGHRVEPAAVEAVLRGITGVQDAAVGIHPARPDSLVALLVLDAGGPSPEEVRRRLRALLPSWSVPDHLIAVDRIPLTRNGKFDLGAIPPARLEPATVAPTGPVQVAKVSGSPAPASLEAAIREVFGRVPGPDEHFFEAGLSSLDILRLHRRLTELFDSELPVVDLFQFPTLRSLTERLAARARTSAPAVAPAPRTASGAVATSEPSALTELQARRAARKAFNRSTSAQEKGKL